jgi:hypothetical protein
VRRQDSSRAHRLFSGAVRFLTFDTFAINNAVHFFCSLRLLHESAGAAAIASCFSDAAHFLAAVIFIDSVLAVRFIS